jgi:ferredoxin-NADP reductase
MLGKTNWRIHTADAWSYAMNIVRNYLLIGWSCGVSILEAESSIQLGHQPIKPFDGAALKKFRASNSDKWDHFFALIGKEIDGGCCLSATVNRLIDEPDVSIARDHINALGRRHRVYHGLTIEALASISHKWMSLAKTAFGTLFTPAVALDWALLWELVATGMWPEYKTNKLSRTLEQLTSPYGAVTAKAPPKAAKPVLTLKEKVEYPQDVAILRFHSNVPVKMRAGQFVKLRFHLPGETSAKSRFYSVASNPNPVTHAVEEFEFLVKEVKQGKVSPFLVRELSPEDTCELLTVAGGFSLPEPVCGSNRLMISAGVGIVAFMSKLRYAVALAENGLVRDKISLALIHSERHLSFPFLNELMMMAKRYWNNEKFSFDFTLCITRPDVLETIARVRENCPWMTVKSQRVDKEILSTTRDKFSDPSKLPVYGCGPRTFQKMVRETILKELGHNRKLMNLEFFDL